MCSQGGRQAHMNCRDLCFLQMLLLNSGQGLELKCWEKRPARGDGPFFLSQCSLPWKHRHLGRDEPKTLEVKLPSPSAWLVSPASSPRDFRSNANLMLFSLMCHFFLVSVTFSTHTWNDVSLLCLVTPRVSKLSPPLKNKIKSFLCFPGQIRVFSPPTPPSPAPCNIPDLEYVCYHMASVC